MNADQLLLSIIIPAYKVEAYIERCIRSLMVQDLAFEEYEVLVVNDGSPDRSREIVEQLQSEFRNIRLFNQENQGVSMARNRALAESRGKYVLPIDPDDYVVPQALGRVVKRADSDQLDILYLGFEVMDKSGEVVWATQYSSLANGVYSGTQGYFLSRPEGTMDPDRSWAVLYCGRMLREYNIVYPKGVPFLEDALFLIKVCAVACRVGFDSEVFYERTTRMGSATNSRLFTEPRATTGFLIAACELVAFQYSSIRHDRGLVNHGVAKFVILSIQSCLSKDSILSLGKTLGSLRSMNLRKLDLDGCKSIYRYFGGLYNLSPWLLTSVLLLRAVWMWMWNRMSRSLRLNGA